MVQSLGTFRTMRVVRGPGARAPPYWGPNSSAEHGDDTWRPREIAFLSNSNLAITSERWSEELGDMRSRRQADMKRSVRGGALPRGASTRSKRRLLPLLLSMTRLRARQAARGGAAPQREPSAPAPRKAPHRRRSRPTGRRAMRVVDSLRRSCKVGGAHVPPEARGRAWLRAPGSPQSLPLHVLPGASLGSARASFKAATPTSRGLAPGLHATLGSPLCCLRGFATTTALGLRGR